MFDTIQVDTINLHPRPIADRRRRCRRCGRVLDVRKVTNSITPFSRTVRWPCEACGLDNYGPMELETKS